MGTAITVEPLTAHLRSRAGLEHDPAHLAIVHTTGLGELVAVLETATEYSGIYDRARAHGERVGAPVLTLSSYRPTVVGADVARWVAEVPDCQPERITR